MTFRVMLLPGDGIGPDIVSSAVKVMKLVSEKMSIPLEFTEGLMGGCSYDKYGSPLTEEVLSQSKASDAVLLGAVGGPKWETLPHHLKPEAALLRIRKELELFANIRPAKVYDCLVDSSSLKTDVVKGTDFIVLRELTGGIYFGEPRGYDENRGWNTMVYTKAEVERIARMAFEMARTRKGRVMSVDKANVLEVSQLWRTVVHEVHKEYTDVTLSDMYVDNAAMQIVRNPGQFDVIVTGNLFGDILSDISGMITGSLGMLPSASMGTKYALYEPIHGSAPDIAGQNKANPLATIASAAMLFEHSMKNQKAASVVNDSIEAVLSEGYRTADIYSEGTKLMTTTEMTEAVLEQVQKLLSKK
ncbi:MAG TPA: 3-isopropylmalate dehydrogenase [Ignavibacteriales bacterium]|nr:3-isopropylmalate dehydrogenase [Ignavibacteriales bacterium]